MNDKKYQVFISSTYTDLAEERKRFLMFFLWQIVFRQEWKHLWRQIQSNLK